MRPSSTSFALKITKRIIQPLQLKEVIPKFLKVTCIQRSLKLSRSFHGLRFP